MRGTTVDWNVKGQRLMEHCHAIVAPGSLSSAYESGKLVWRGEIQVWGSPESAEKHWNPTDGTSPAGMVGMAGDRSSKALDYFNFGPVPDNPEVHPEQVLLDAFVQKAQQEAAAIPK